MEASAVPPTLAPASSTPPAASTVIARPAATVATADGRRESSERAPSPAGADVRFDAHAEEPVEAVVVSAASEFVKAQGDERHVLPGHNAVAVDVGLGVDHGSAHDVVGSSERQREVATRRV